MVSIQAKAWPSKSGLGPGWGLPEPRGWHCWGSLQAAAGTQGMSASWIQAVPGGGHGGGHSCPPGGPDRS